MRSRNTGGRLAGWIIQGILAPHRAAARFAGLALQCLQVEYPNHVSHTLNGDPDARPPRELTPAFCGWLDWHSDVQGDWAAVAGGGQMRGLLGRFLPQTPRRVGGHGRAESKLAHGLPPSDSRIAVLSTAAARHREAALPFAGLGH